MLCRYAEMSETVGACFGKHEASTADRPAAQMHDVPVVRKPVCDGILAHRRNKYAVGKRVVLQVSQWNKSSKRRRRSPEP